MPLAKAGRDMAGPAAGVGDVVEGAARRRRLAIRAGMVMPICTEVAVIAMRI
jgi:hypothetical protein